MKVPPYYQITSWFFSVIFLFLSLQTIGQTKTYYTGHSLINLDVPYQTQLLVKESGKSNSYRLHINNGASIKLNWIDTLFNPNPIWDPSLGYDVEFGTNHLRELKKKYDNIVLTEAVPLLNYKTDTTVKYFVNFFDIAAKASPEIKGYVFATWEGDVASSTWASKVKSLMPEWEKIRELSKNQSNIKEVFIIPGNLAMLKLNDVLKKGSIGTLNSLTQLFDSDGIHPNSKGKYFMACLFAAVIYDIDPRGLTTVKAGPYNNNIVIGEKIVREKLQEIAFETACTYKFSGYSNSKCYGSTNSIKSKKRLNYWPNPTASFLNFTKNQSEIMLVSSTGKVVKLVTNTKVIDLSNLPNGIYNVHWKNETESSSSKIVVLK